jgi:hypothetical protein
MDNPMTHASGSSARSRQHLLVLESSFLGLSLRNSDTSVYLTTGSLFEVERSCQPNFSLRAGVSASYKQRETPIPIWNRKLLRSGEQTCSSSFSFLQCCVAFSLLEAGIYIIS